jgi:hypothetical protein
MTQINIDLNLKLGEIIPVNYIIKDIIYSNPNLVCIRSSSQFSRSDDISFMENNKSDIVENIINYITEAYTYSMCSFDIVFDTNTIECSFSVDEYRTGSLNIYNLKHEDVVTIKNIIVTSGINSSFGIHKIIVSFDNKMYVQVDSYVCDKDKEKYEIKYFNYKKI